MRKYLPEQYLNPTSIDKMTEKPLSQALGIILGVCVMLGLFCSIACAGQTALKDLDVIKSIVGEGESEPYMGKLALGATILNRGHLKGVYALKNVVIKDGKWYKRVSKKSRYYKRTGKELRPIDAEDVRSAKLAWEYIKKNGNGEWSATGWGTKEDIAIFKRQGWFKNCKITSVIGNHYFYRELR